MSRFFTSDLHLGSTLINKYAHRPFVSAQDAVSNIVANINDTVKQTDTLIHVGDFQLLGYDRHGEVDDKGLDFTLNDYLGMIKCRTFLIEGNHDSGHNCEADAKSMTLDLNQNYRNVTVGHYPSTSQVIKKTWSGRTVFTKHSVDGYQGWNGTAQKPHIHLCGHVHDKWILNFDAAKNVLNVNVGVDVWDYKPVRDSEITELLDYFRATMWTKISPSPGKWTNFTLTRKALDEFKIAHSAEVKAQREARKVEKHLKKGLTPEICQQRKEEALRKKGLLK